MKFGKKNHISTDIWNYLHMMLGESKIGKEQPVSSKVLTQSGWKKMRDIHEGEYVYGDNGKLYKVTGVFPQGIKKVYKLTFKDGTSACCGEEHLWDVQAPKMHELYSNTEFETVKLSDIMDDYKNYRIDAEQNNGGMFNYKYNIPIASAIPFDNKEELIIPPYSLGLLLEMNGATLASMGQKSFDELRGESPNAFKDELIKLGLYNCDLTEKFIPKKYMYSSIENRVLLLSALINTGGYVTNARLEISTYSKQLSKDIAEVARSLGFISSVKTHVRTNEIKYAVSIISDDFSMLYLSEKHKNKLNSKGVRYVKSLEKIEFDGYEECQCIMVDNPLHRYITDDYIVTHNTTVTKSILEKTVNPEDGYLFLEIQDERGADAIEGINYVNTDGWYNDYNEVDNSIGFGTIIDDIVKNKTIDYKNLRVVVFDTFDQLILISEKHTIETWNSKMLSENKPEKCVDSINAAYGGFGAGQKKAIEFMLDAIDKLKSVGVQTFIIGHIKNKDIIDPITNQTYTILSADSQQNYFNAIKKNVHILSMAYVDRDIVKEKTGRKDIKGKDVVIDKISSESRKIRFRDNSYATDTGSRFADIVPEIPLDADAYIKAVQDAIKNEIKKGGRNLDEAVAETKNRENAEKEQVEAKKKKSDTANLKKEMMSLIAKHKTEPEVIKALISKSKELGYENPAQLDKTEDIHAMIDLINSYTNE